MPSYIVKASPDEDFYVVWSTVVDAPTGWGTRAALEHWRPGPDTAPERFDRADDNGTSAAWTDWPKEDQPYAWGDSDGFGLGEVGPEREGGGYRLPRANLRAFCERLETDERGTKTADLLVFEAWGDDSAEHVAALAEVVAGHDLARHFTSIEGFRSCRCLCGRAFDCATFQSWEMCAGSHHNHLAAEIAASPAMRDLLANERARALREAADYCTPANWTGPAATLIHLNHWLNTLADREQS